MPNHRIDSTGKRTTPVPEQKALDHLTRQSATVDIDERSRPAAAFVDVHSEELLAGPRSPDDEHGQARPRVPLGQRDRASYRR